MENGWKDGYNKPIKVWKSKANGVIPHLKTIQPQGKYKLDINHNQKTSNDGLQANRQCRYGWHRLF